MGKDNPVSKAFDHAWEINIEWLPLETSDSRHFTNAGLELELRCQTC
jgi:hypothetical protein